LAADRRKGESVEKIGDADDADADAAADCDDSATQHRRTRDRKIPGLPFESPRRTDKRLVAILVNVGGLLGASQRVGRRVCKLFQMDAAKTSSRSKGVVGETRTKIDDGQTAHFTVVRHFRNNTRERNKDHTMIDTGKLAPFDV
jgi:hypothetical protein